MTVEKMKQWIEQLSVNQSKSISPMQLKRFLRIGDQELKELVEYLYKMRILTYRFRFICQCTNECIAYDRALNAGKYVCSECGRTITFDDIRKKCEVAYEINKEEAMKIGNEPTIDFTKDALENSVVKLGICRKHIEGEKNMKEMVKPTIFFGSSCEAANKMDEVAAIVATQGCTTLKWNSPNAAENTIDNLISVTENVDAAIFIFNVDDITWYDKKPASGTVRNNVLFEYGLFMGALGKTKVAIMYNKDPHIPSDLNGITYINLNDDEAIWTQRLKLWINKLKK